MTWWLRQGGPGGRVTGPHGEAELLRKIAANAVNSMDEVSEDGTAWTRVRRTPLWRPMAAPEPRGAASGPVFRPVRPGDGSAASGGGAWTGPGAETGRGRGQGAAALEGVPVGFAEAWKRGWTRWSWAGRASRSEYWWRMVSMCLEMAVLGAVDAALFADAAFTPLSWVYQVALFVPRTGVFVRRLHDTGKSGWWWFFGFVPVAGAVLLLVWTCMPGDAGPNGYGAVPFAKAEWRPRRGAAAGAEVP